MFLIVNLADDHCCLDTAAGNGAGGDNTSYYYPASYKHVISVTTIGSAYNPNTFYTSVGPYTNVGVNWKDCHEIIINHPEGYYDSQNMLKLNTHQNNDKVDICAPGFFNAVLGDNNGTDAAVGSSIASPMVAGAVALLYSININFTPDQIENFLKQSAVDIYNISTNNKYIGKLGAGRLNAGAAVLLASQSSCLPAFNNIVWKSGTTIITNNNIYSQYISSNPTLNFSISNGSVAAGATVEWEFKSGPNIVVKTGSSVNLNWGTDFSTYTGQDKRYDVFPLEVYVRQKSNCCYSPYYKEKGYTSNVDNGNFSGSYPNFQCYGGTMVYTSGTMPPIKAKAGNFYLGSGFQSGTGLVTTTSNFTTYLQASNEIQILPGFNASVTGNGSFHLSSDINKCSEPSQGSLRASVVNISRSNSTKNNDSVILFDNRSIIESNGIIVDLYPNPTQKFLNVCLKVSADQNVNIKIINSIGQVLRSINKFVRNSSNQVKYDLNLSDLNQGIYFITINGKNSFINKAILKIN